MNFDIFGGFQKNEYYFGYIDFVNIFGGLSQKISNYKGSFLCILGYFLKVKVQNGGHYWVAKISIFILRVVEISDICFLGER